MTRTRYSKEEKLRVVREAIEASNTAAVARRQYCETRTYFGLVSKIGVSSL